MRIPQPILAALSELFSNDGQQQARNPSCQLNGYQINARRWSCRLANSDTEAWCFHPLELNKGDSIPNPKLFETASEPWSLDEQLTRKVQEWIGKTGVAAVVDDLPGRICVISSYPYGAVLSARCTDVQLVAYMLQTWGNPPESVVRDWQNQLKIRPESSPKPSTAETLVTADGTLIPLADLIHQIECQTVQGAPLSSMRSPNPPLVFPFAPDWPICISQANTATKAFETPTNPALESNRISASESTGDGPFSLGSKNRTSGPNKFVAQPPNPQKKNSKRLTIGFLTATIAILAIAIWQRNPSGKLFHGLPENSDRFGSTAPIDPLASTPNRPVGGRDSTTSEASVGGEPNDSELAELVTTSNPMDMLADASLQPEMTVDSLLSQLTPKNQNSIRLNSVTASTIIRAALAPAGSGLPDSSQEAPKEIDSELAEVPERVDLQAVLTDRGVISLERPLKIQAAKTKETVAVGAFVLAKACRCEIELKLMDTLVAEPTEDVTIEGIGIASWKIAIEDEEPELIVELSSKPGARWQVTTSVWLREIRGATPVLIGPREAQFVGNRLIDYREWINASIETLRNARSNSRGRSNIDFPSEIKKLERQQREAEKAIDRWKVIARLSHYFFDSNEIRIHFTAIEKP